MEKQKEWFLIKQSWVEDFKDLTDAEFGMLIRGLYSGTCTSVKSLDMLRKAIQSEFDIVNTKAEESYKARSSKAKDAANARWSKHKELEQERMHKHAQALNNIPKHTQAFDIHAQASLSNANIEEEEDIEYSSINSSNSSMVVEDLIEYIPDTKLSREELIQKSQLIFQ